MQVKCLAQYVTIIEFESNYLFSEGYLKPSSGPQLQKSKMMGSHFLILVVPRVDCDSWPGTDRRQRWGLDWGLYGTGRLSDLCIVFNIIVVYM